MRKGAPGLEQPGTPAGAGKAQAGGSSGSHGTCLLLELLRVWSPFLEWRGHAGGPSGAGDEGLKVMSVPFSSLGCPPPDRPPCTPLCAGQAEGWGPREGPCPGPVIWNLVRGSEALPGVKVGGILLLSVWPIIGLELWGLRRSDRALGDFSRQGTPFHCPKRRPSPHCPPREGKRPTLREVRLPVPHLRVVFRPDRRQKQSFPRRAFGATHGAGQSLTEGLGVRDSGTRLAIPCPVFLGLFPEASGRGLLQPLYTEASSPPRRSRREDRRLRHPL